MKNPVIISDIDGVAVDWLQGYINFMESTHNILALHNKPTDFGMTDIFPDLEKPWMHIPDYHHSEFYTQIKAYDDAKKAFNWLHRNGFRIILLTACGDSDIVQNARTENIEKEFGNVIEDLIMLPYASSKLNALAKLPQGAFIEDQMKVALEGVETGKNTFIRNMPYNVNDHHDQVTRIDSLLDLPSQIKKIAPELLKSSDIKSLSL